MTAAGAAPAGDAPAALRPLTSTAAVVLLVAALAVVALVSVGVDRLLPADSGGVIISGESVPARPAPALTLAGVAPSVTFEGAGPGLPTGALGPWSVEAGAWTVDDGAARATEVGDLGALAVVVTGTETRAAQITLTGPRAGAGLVVSFRSPDAYVALQVGRGGRSVELVEVDGRRDRPRAVLVAEVSTPGSPLVLAVRRVAGGFEAVANGVRLGYETLGGGVDGPWRVGLTTGTGPEATATRFDDLVVR